MKTHYPYIINTLSTLSLPRVSKIKIQEKFHISFCKILKNKWHHAKVLPKRFHLNGHTIGFHSQTQKLELHDLTYFLISVGEIGRIY